MFQLVRACEQGLGVQADRTSIFFGVKLMFVGVMNFGQVQEIRFVVMTFFWSYSNQFSVVLIRSSELASNYNLGKVKTNKIIVNL